MRFLNVLVPCLVSLVNAAPRSDCKCGVENVDFLKARPRQVKYPWIVALFNADKRAYCSGTLISDQHVLTDGKCVSQDTGSLKHIEKIRGSVGVYDLKLGGKLEFDNVFIQPNQQNNLAILKLKKKIDKFSPSLLPICVPASKTPRSGIAITQGYGTSDNRAKKKFGVVQDSEIAITQCEKRDSPTICGMKKGMDTCSHDLGSPLFAKSSSGRYELIGLTSVQDKCGGKKPRIYTDTSAFLQWIQNIINSAGVCGP